MSSLARLIKKDRGNYTNTSNLIIRDDRLHWNSRGIFVYLWSQANEWQFYVKEVVKHSPGGETELRTALKELEKYGYLKRTPRHGQSGSFNGMDWILSDVGGLNRHTGSPDDGSINENQPKESDYPSSAKPVERETRRTENLTLRNNNNKNYQQQEVTKISKEDIDSSTNVEHHIPYEEIVDYLNRKTSANYKSTTKPTQRLIKARWHEGYRLDDFKKVVDNKASEWQGDSKMWKYMRPATLFGSKFDDYLNANNLDKSRKKPTTGGYEEILNGKNIQDIPDDELPF